MDEVVSINSKQLAVKKLFGQRVVTLKDIDELHERPEGTASRNFSSNKKHFIEGEDYFYLSNAEVQSTKFVNYNCPKGLVLLTESGYLMLVKSLTDDLAWTVQKELINGYFRAKSDKPMGLEDLIILQAQSVKDLKAKVSLIEERVTVVNHRIDSLDNIDPNGDLRYRLNQMVKKYAWKKGLAFNKAWGDFKQAFNASYGTNLELRITNCEKRTGIRKMTIPQFLAIENILEDGVRVADKLLNAS